MPSNLTPATLDAIDAAERAATPGPYVRRGSFEIETVDFRVADCNCRNSADYFTLAANNAPALVAALRGALRVVEAIANNETWNRLYDRVDEFRHDHPGLLPETVSGEEDHAE